MKSIVSRITLRTILTPSLIALMAGCGIMGNKGADYRSQGNKLPPLEVPPDLTVPSADDRFVIPDPKATTYSTYNRDKAALPAATPSSVLPKIDNARIERAGTQHWLVVKAAPDKVWPVIKEFWLENGFVLKRETPEAGIMETDWSENRSKIPQDPIRNALGRFIDGAWSTPERDKFRTRLEPGAETGTTDIYISHRGMQEIFTSGDRDRTAWQPRPADTDLEVEMLGRLMVKFGQGSVSPAAPVTGTTVAALRAVYDKDKGGALKVNEPFDRAWRRVGLALDRIGFTVEDRDRSKGVFFVRYIDPDADLQASKSFIEKLMFWRKGPENKPQYRIQMSEAAGISDVVVQDAKGGVENSPTGKRILSLLYEQLK